MNIPLALFLGPLLFNMGDKQSMVRNPGVFFKLRPKCCQPHQVYTKWAHYHTLSEKKGLKIGACL